MEQSDGMEFSQGAFIYCVCGVLSPVLFGVYVDDLIVKLSESGEGCCINGMYVGCVMYADDLVLLSASLTSLQTMTDICESEAQYLDMNFNVTKSAVLRVGCRYKYECLCTSLCGINLQYVDKAWYLGIFIVAGKRFRISLSEPIKNFYRASMVFFTDLKGI